MPRPGWVVRAALVTFGALFLPLGLWFAYSNFARYWGDALGLIVVSIVFLRLGFTRNEDSWIAAVDAIGDVSGTTRKHK